MGWGVETERGWEERTGGWGEGKEGEKGGEGEKGEWEGTDRGGGGRERVTIR